MAEIPGFVWIIVGLFISGFSFFIGFIRDDSAFFKLTFFIGLIMLLYGGIKIFLRTRNKDTLIDEMRKRHAQKGDIEIDMEDSKRQQQAPHQHSTQHVQTSNKKITHGFCNTCGTPLLKHHKFCPICGSKV